MSEDSGKIADGLHEDIRTESLGLMDDVQRFSAQRLEGEPISMGDLLEAATAFSTRGAHISAVAAIQTSTLNKVAVNTYEAVEKVSRDAKATLARVDTLATQTASLNEVATGTYETVERVSRDAEATLTRVDTVAKDARSISDRVERLHQPRGLFLLGVFVVLSNAAVAAAIIGLYYLGTAILSQVNVSRGLATGIVSSLIAAALIGVLTWIGKLIKNLLQGGQSKQNRAKDGE
ncbi:hypothetical protein [Ornithinimicrobium pratense]|uniref:Uncharacterized protein n=1 Tax=Ornithinimicrobium pratense TaxID=2593973 RepID=A0A5J6V7K0_9MICO|nr:hypothetical protein [Ornithinimicrobium pratense]QFG69053.1 hypothetical protein FY030_10365 [Ornithinimicrobium pratense]